MAQQVQPKPVLAQPQHRQRLAFSSSIYSCRRNRSLPDLANLASLDRNNNNNKDDQEERRAGPGMAKRTGKLDILKREQQGQPLKHSCSASTALKNFDVSAREGGGGWMNFRAN